jgi:hypothetical protein
VRKFFNATNTTIDLYEKCNVDLKILKEFKTASNNTNSQEPFSSSLNFEEGNSNESHVKPKNNVGTKQSTSLIPLESEKEIQKKKTAEKKNRLTKLKRKIILNLKQKVRCFSSWK